MARDVRHSHTVEGAAEVAELRARVEKMQAVIEHLVRRLEGRAYWYQLGSELCWQRRKFVVVGFVPESTAGISALRLGEMRGGKLMYAGKVGTGWGRETAADIRAKLDRLIRPKSPLDERIRKPDTRWVEPRFQADVEFAEISDDGRVRHPAFRGSMAEQGALYPSRAGHKAAE